MVSQDESYSMCQQQNQTMQHLNCKLPAWFTGWYYIHE